jgi:hypothetical protein
MTWPDVFEQRLTGELPAAAATTPTRRNGGALRASPDRQQRKQTQKQQQPVELSLVPVANPPPAAAAAAAATLSAATLYAAARLGVEAYKNLRRRALRRLLLDVCPALDAMSASYFVDFGTLLGLHRERDVILHDNDADVVLLEPDFDALLPRLRDALPQFRVYEVVPSEDATVRWLRVMAGPLGAPLGIMDLYGGWRSECGKRIGIPQGHGDLCDIDAHLVLPTGRMRWRGCSLACPRDVEGVLVHRYGPTWHVPRYMDKGRDEVEQGKPYVKVLSALGKVGLRI